MSSVNWPMWSLRLTSWRSPSVYNLRSRHSHAHQHSTSRTVLSTNKFMQSGRNVCVCDFGYRNTPSSTFQKQQYHNTAMPAFNETHDQQAERKTIVSIPLWWYFHIQIKILKGFISLRSVLPRLLMTVVFYSWGLEISRIGNQLDTFKIHLGEKAVGTTTSQNKTCPHAPMNKH